MRQLKRGAKLGDARKHVSVWRKPLLYVKGGLLPKRFKAFHGGVNPDVHEFLSRYCYSHSLSMSSYVDGLLHLACREYELGNPPPPLPSERDMDPSDERWEEMLDRSFRYGAEQRRAATERVDTALHNAVAEAKWYSDLWGAIGVDEDVMTAGLVLSNIFCQRQTH